MIWNAVIFGPGQSQHRFPRLIHFFWGSERFCIDNVDLSECAIVIISPHSTLFDALIIVLNEILITELTGIHYPADTPFEDGTFRLILTFDESYPNKRMSFMSPF
jgi:hypothetical protein